MSRTYGVAAEREGIPASEVENEDAHAPLLGVAHTLPDKSVNDGVAGLTSSVGNLANTIIGSGMLTFPLAMASSGLIPGIVTCIFSGFCAAFGLYLLSLCAPYAPKRHSSFFAIAHITFPRAAIIFDAAIAIKCFGVSVSYLIIIKGLMPNVVEALYHDLSAHDAPEWSQSSHIWLTIFMGILIPLSFLRRLDQLRHTSYVALFAVVYLVLIVVVCFIHPPEGIQPRGEVWMVHFTPSFVGNFPVQVFAFTCAQNLFPIYNELRSNTQKRMNMVIGSSIGGAVLTYEIIAILGYLTFGDKVQANIIQMYPSTSLFIAIGQAAIVVLVLFSYALQVQPCRNCLDKVFGDHAAQLKAPKNTTVTTDEDEIEDEMAPSEMSVTKHVLLTAGIVAAGYSIAYFVDDLRIVLSFVGSTGSTTISFILPGLFYWKLFADRELNNRGKRLRMGAACLTIYGIGILIFCLTYNIYAVFTGIQAPH